jgi:4-amino-4-deoxy-L-arabinose transferase-like glycosyltransferase
MINFLYYINSITRNLIPLLILINFILLLILIYLNWKFINQFFIKIDKKTWLILITIFICALSLRLFIPEIRHIMYIDEGMYMEAGKNMLNTGSQMEYAKPIGWSFLLSLVFGIFGINNWVALYTSLFLGALTIVLMFFVTFLITKNKPLSLFASFIFSLIPVHIRWSASAETNVPSLFFVLLSLFFCLLYYESPKKSLLWLSLVSISFASQFRVENYSLFVIFLSGYLLFYKRIKSYFDLILPFVVSFVITLPNLVQSVVYYNNFSIIHGYPSDILKLNILISNLIHNTLNYAPSLWDYNFQPLLFTFLVMIGFIYSFFLKNRKQIIFLISYFVFFWLAMFIVGSTLNFNVEIQRFFIVFLPILIILMNYGLLFIKQNLFFKPLINKIIYIIFLFILVLMYVPYIFDYSMTGSNSAYLLETKIPELAERDIPLDCYIVAVNPVILRSTTNLNVVDIYNFLDHNESNHYLEKECLLFFDDVCCSDYYFTDRHHKKCQEIKQKYILFPYLNYTEEQVTYNFYNITKQ